ncbi:DUF433 domain-containing protein [Desulfofundulus sp.]|uniref:DUF433 domain-containing protein n=1 Tax=Desulfofundulus sp. TaxID=2282750 RepID=UPI003C7110B6
MDANFLERIQIDPDVLLGKPVIKGTRISVSFLLNALTTMSVEELLKAYPFLTKEDVTAALYYAANIVDKPAKEKEKEGIDREILAQ